jgi:FolB domain-containing protein
MPDRIEIRGLRVQTIVGVRDDERLAMRTLLIDLEIDTDLRVPGASDDIKDSVDYDRLAQRVREVVSGSAHRLVEKVAEDVAKACRDTPNVRQVTVTVHKPGAVADCDDVAVTITR